MKGNYKNMKFWFYDFLDEMTQNICKMWIAHKKKKDINFVEDEKLQKKVRFIIKTILVVVLAVVVVSFFFQVISSM